MVQRCIERRPQERGLEAPNGKGKSTEGVPLSCLVVCLQRSATLSLPS